MEVICLMQKFNMSFAYLPKLKFEISILRDVETFFCFLHDAEYDNGESMKMATLKPYPELSVWFDGVKFVATRKNVKDFVQAVYDKNADLIKKNLIIYERNWKQVRGSYVKLIKILFPNTDWPDGEYIVYPTIWGMYPRFLDNCTFQVPFKHKKMEYVSVVIAHELLHFIWYANAYASFPDLKNADDFYVWNISEIFNSLVQNSSSWVEVFGMESMIYPMHELIIKKIENNLSDISLLNADEITKEIIITFDAQ